jgi:exodeoxyribonuclease V alpha subunit
MAIQGKILSDENLQPILANEDLFSNLDRHFAAFISRLADKDSPELTLAAALVSSKTAEGNICIDLKKFAGMVMPVNAFSDSLSSSIVCPSIFDWRQKLNESGITGQPDDNTPLVLDGTGRLYLRRYWEYENQVGSFILERGTKKDKKIDYAKLGMNLKSLFPTRPAKHTDWQEIAAIAAITRFLCIISGGPGTGKTYTVAKILALINMQADNSGECRILLGAPTGKAAARLQESLAKSQVLDHETKLPQATTLHRMLGSLPDSPYFRHNSENPLHADVIIVDEASMVDLPLMAKLMQAVPPQAKLILLGDRNQLASVQPGSVLGDICQLEYLPCFTPKFQKQVYDLTGRKPEIDDSCAKSPENIFLQDSIVELKKGFRFSSDSGIELLSKAVNKGDADAAQKILFSNNTLQVTWSEITSPDDLPEKLGQWPGFQEIAAMQQASDPADCFAILNRNRILCGLRSGPYGGVATNQIIAHQLHKKQLTGTKQEKKNNLAYDNYGSGQTLCSGQPVMITRNDYSLQLFNGDVGIALPDPEAQNKIRIFFTDESGVLRKIPPAMLPAHETVFAMTVHKSQGSEFEKVLLILPDQDSPVLTRELLYTAITRAREKIEIWGSTDVLCNAITKQIMRESGLNERLWG